MSHNLRVIRPDEPTAPRSAAAPDSPHQPPTVTYLHLLYLVASLPIFAFIHATAYWLRLDGQLHLWLPCIAVTAIWTLSVKAVVFHFYRVYRGWNRYLTFYDLMTLSKAATLSSLILVLADYLFMSSLAIPRSVFMMDWGATIVIVGGLRAAWRWIEEHRIAHSIEKSPVFIVGTDDSGEELLRTIRRSPDLPHEVVGFLSDSETIGTQIGGVPVLGKLDEMCRLALKLGVRDVLISSGALNGKRVRELVTAAAESSIDVQVLPSMKQLVAGKVDMQPRKVSIEDLLRREPVQLDQGKLQRWLDGRTLLVTGSAGSIGSEICRQLLQFKPAKIVVVDRSENGQFFLERELQRLAPHHTIEVCVGDVTDAKRMDNIFQKYKPDIVFHAAAYKHVPMMEANAGEAVKNIVLATRQLADLSERHEVDSFVMISTDKAVNPTSVMGACKRIAELYVQTLAARSNCRFVTVRFGNVLDSAGSVVPIFRQQIARGGPVTVTDPNMIRYFMMIPEASQLVIQAGAMGHGGEIFVLDMGEPVRIVDLAEDLIRLSGLRVGEDIEIRFCGMRPGEKLFEELLISGEKHLPTAHEKIMVAESEDFELSEITSYVETLAALIDGSSDPIRSALRRFVPHYHVKEIAQSKAA